MTKTPKAAAKAASTPNKPADKASEVAEKVTAHDPESEGGKAEMGAAVTPTQPPAAEPKPSGKPPQSKPAYVAAWSLRANGKRYAAGKDVPELSEAETASLLKLGAIRAR